MSKVSEIADDLIACTTLTHLDLSCEYKYVEITRILILLDNRKNHFSGLEKVVAEHEQLRTVVLSKKRVLPETMEGICTSLKTNNAITHLDLASMQAECFSSQLTPLQELL